MPIRATAIVRVGSSSIGSAAATTSSSIPDHQPDSDRKLSVGAQPLLDFRGHPTADCMLSCLAYDVSTFQGCKSDTLR
jgi:hypothetical protein